jgi:hypothetical protein
VALPSFLLRLAIVAAVVLTSLGIARAEPELAGRHWFNSDFESLEGREFNAAEFREHARVRLTPERRLPNGVSWRLFTDTRTTTAMPRITWMPWRESMIAANRFLETMHGAAIQDVRRLITTWKYYSAAGSGRRRVSLSTVFGQGPVALTYASRRFVSLLEQGSMQYDERAGATWSRGLVFDIDTGKVFAAESCKGSDFRPRYGEREDPADWQPPYGARTDFPGFFTYGGLMHVCDVATYTSFRAVVVRWAAETMKVSRTRGSKAECWQWAKLLHDEDWPMLIVLTHAGLALHTYRQYTDQPVCAAGYAAPDPVIVPYRELAPFFRPGPLRDELLR